MKQKLDNAYKTIGEVAKALDLINPKNGKLNTHKLKFAVLIELFFRMSDRFIQGDLVWLYNF